MSSKFSGILAQARHRPIEEQEHETPEHGTQEHVVLVGAAPALLPSKDTSLEWAQQPSNPTASKEPSIETQLVNPPLKGRPRGKRSDPDFTQITAYISKKTHQEVKLALLQEGNNREISQLIEQCLSGWLEERKS